MHHVLLKLVQLKQRLTLAKVTVLFQPSKNDIKPYDELLELSDAESKK